MTIFHIKEEETIFNGLGTIEIENNGCRKSIVRKSGKEYIVKKGGGKVKITNVLPKKITAESVNTVLIIRRV